MFLIELRQGLVWPLLSLALLLTVTFVLISIGTYECVAYGHADCEAATRCVTPCAVFIAVVIWLFAATAVSMRGESDGSISYCAPSTKRLYNAKARAHMPMIRWPKHMPLNDTLACQKTLDRMCTKLGVVGSDLVRAHRTGGNSARVWKCFSILSNSFESKCSQYKVAPPTQKNKYCAAISSTEYSAMAASEYVGCRTSSSRPSAPRDDSPPVGVSRLLRLVFASRNSSLTGRSGSAAAAAAAAVSPLDTCLILPPPASPALHLC